MVVKYLKNPLFISTLICIFAVYSGFFRVPEKEIFESIIPQSEILSLSGEVKSSPCITSRRDDYYVILKVSDAESDIISASARGKIKIFIPASEIESFYPGKLYTSSLSKAFIEEGIQLKVNGSFIKNGFKVKSIIYSGYENSIIGNMMELRSIMRLYFKRMMFAWKDAGGLILALLSGSKEYLAPDTSEAFRKAGLSHILALSGMHLSMISGIGHFIGNLFKRKKLTHILQLFLINFFVWFTGFSPSLLRAFICTCVMLLEEIINSERSDFIIVLCFSFLAQTIISPNDLQSIGFILSYGALAGILLSADLYNRMYSAFIPPKLASSFSASCGAQMITLPISLKKFGYINPFGIIASVFVSPLITIFIYSGFILMVLTFIFPSFLKAGGIFMQFQYNLIDCSVSFFSKLPAVKLNKIY